MAESGIQKLGRLLRERADWSENQALAAAALLMRELAEADGMGPWVVKPADKSKAVFRVMREDGTVQVWLTREADDAQSIAEVLNVFCPPSGP
jgi:hypothetical protein